MIRFLTSHGTIDIKLDFDNAPITAENFARYAKEGFYNGTIFHRVIPNFVVQGGGMTAGMEEKETYAPIKNEADNGLKNLRGTLSMARTPDPHSASSQFFINLVDNPFLDFSGKTPHGWGYAVFATVVAGMEVVDAIASVPTGNYGYHSDVPLEEIVIENTQIIDDSFYNSFDESTNKQEQ